MADDIKKVLRKFEYGVYVITMGKGETGNAFTASWLTQVSSEPPMIALAVHKKRQSIPLLREHQAFVVNLIGEGQEAVAKSFYGPAEAGYEKLKARTLKDSPATGSPVLQGVLGFLDCRIVQTIDAGNHLIFIGEVQAAGAESDQRLLTASNSGLRYTG